MGSWLKKRKAAGAGPTDLVIPFVAAKPQNRKRKSSCGGYPEGVRGRRVEEGGSRAQGEAVLVRGDPPVPSPTGRRGRRCGWWRSHEPAALPSRRCGRQLSQRLGRVGGRPDGAGERRSDQEGPRRMNDKGDAQVAPDDFENLPPVLTSAEAAQVLRLAGERDPAARRSRRHSRGEMRSPACHPHCALGDPRVPRGQGSLKVGPPVLVLQP